MKKATILVITFCLFIAQFGFAQAKKKKPQPKVPAVVQQAFSAKYPDLKPKDWDWEPEKEIYEADFMQNGKEREASFSVTGKWEKTKTEITQAELPAAVSQAVAAQMSGWTMDDLSEVESAEKGIYYKIRFKNGKEEKTLKFDATGKQLQMSPAKAKSAGEN